MEDLGWWGVAGIALLLLMFFVERHVNKPVPVAVMERLCHTCSGYGTKADTTKCDKCGGAGWIRL